MRSLSDDIEDCLRVSCKAQPSVHLIQKGEIKSDGLRSNSKKAYVADAKALIRRSASRRVCCHPSQSKLLDWLVALFTVHHDGRRPHLW